MNSNIDKIKTILSGAEQSLRELIIEAAQEGDYLGVDTARDMAVAVNQLINRLSDGESSTKKNMVNNEIKGKKISRAKKRAGIKKKTPSGYPKFTVRDDTLVRIGWSKKEKREYQHKVPKSLFDLTIKTMGDLAKSRNGPFLAEEIIEQMNENSAESVPGYQVYVVIGFLREQGSIKQEGREGYKIPLDLDKKAEKEWKKLKR